MISRLSFVLALFVGAVVSPCAGGKSPLPFPSPKERGLDSAQWPGHCCPIEGRFFALARGRGDGAQLATVEWRSVAPGVEHAEIVRKGDVAAGAAAERWTINALRIDLAQVRLDVVHALDAAVGLETVSSMAQRRDAIAAINGGYFRTTGTFRGDSTGTLQIDGTLLSEPDRARAAVGFIRPRAGASATQLMFGHVTWDATIDANGLKRPLDGINRPRGADEMVMFTPAFHQTTLTDASGTEIVVRRGRVVEVKEQAGSTPIPPDGFVLNQPSDVTGERPVSDAILVLPAKP
jgi:hypothetical protein